MLCFGVCGRGEVEDTKGGGGRDGVRTGSSSDRRRRLCRLACLSSTSRCINECLRNRVFTSNREKYRPVIFMIPIRVEIHPAP